MKPQSLFPKPSALLTLSAFWLLSFPAALCAAPGTGTPSQIVRGEVRRVATAPELKMALEAANREKVPATLLLADGTYLLDGLSLDLHCPGLVIRSASGNREKVVVRGPDEGPNAALANVFLVSANDVVIADLTLGHCRHHGIQVRGESPFDVSGLLVHNCRLVNCNQQFIKGSSAESDPTGATDGLIEQCLFEFTSGWAWQSYTGGIDIHKGVNWVVRDNLFRNIRTPAGEPGIAEHAIHFWKRCPLRPQNVIVERNWVVNCDRGIGFGLGSAQGGHEGGTSIIRNNLVFNDGTGSRTDVGIGLEFASGVQVDNNTVVVQNYWAPMEYRFAGTSNVVFRNNLVNRPIQRRDSAPPARMVRNLERTEAAWFRDPSAGDLRLTAAATAAINSAQALDSFAVDIDGQARPQGEAWDIGACELAQPLPAGLTILSGAVNAALIERQGRRLAVYGEPSGDTPVDTVLLTQARRDVTWAARAQARHRAGIIAPRTEAEFLNNPDIFWTGLRDQRFHDYAQQSTKMPATPVPLARTVTGGDTLTWQDLSVRVLDTPGYTRGAITYLAELSGRKVAFTGDLIRDDGKLQDLFSLQDAIPQAKIGGYHGWAGRLGDLLQSLDAVAAEKPDLVVPLRGPVIHAPLASIDRLKRRIRAVYANYLSIDALRWYFKDEHILAKARRVLGPELRGISESGALQSTNLEDRLMVMPMAATFPLPEAIIPISNSRLLRARDGSGFLVDCGGDDIVGQLRKLRAAGNLASLEHVFVTHYHDDHTDALPKLVSEFGAKIHACGSLVDVLENPGGYRLPCLTRNPSQVTAKHRDGETWKWHEFEITIFDHPGQTLHHNALLVKQEGGWSAFFAGDSFTPSGIDDYCLQNRNFLHPGQGFFRCLTQLEQLPRDCFILNQHVGPAFRFTPAQIQFMRDTLQARIALLAELLPFDDPNYGLDEGWACCHPYWMSLRAGETARFALRLTNHSPRERVFRAALRMPEGFAMGGVEPLCIAAHTEGELRVKVRVPQDCPTGLHIIAVDVASEGIDLREWSEAVLEVTR